MQNHITRDSSITRGSKKFPVTKAKLLNAMNKVEAAHKAKPIKSLGYMGGVWNEGDYYMSSEDQLEDAIENELFKAL